MKVLVAVDLQNDFINGALGTAEAAAMLPRAERKIRSFEGLVLFTRDTHTEDYLNTREGKALPVPHCIRGSHGWQLAARLLPYASEVIDKPTFGSTALGERLRALNEDAPIESITLIGLCTDICVISNALLLRAYLPEIPIIVDAACCAGVTPESHRTALAAMRACQIIIENEPSVEVTAGSGGFVPPGRGPLFPLHNPPKETPNERTHPCQLQSPPPGASLHHHPPLYRADQRLR